jgi:hypothetical protein
MIRQEFVGRTCIASPQAREYFAAPFHEIVNRRGMLAPNEAR